MFVGLCAVWLMAGTLSACGSDDDPGSDAADADTSDTAPVGDVAEQPDADVDVDVPHDPTEPEDTDVAQDPGTEPDADTGEPSDADPELLLLQPDAPLTVTEGGVTLSIPAGAVTEPTEITFEVLDTLTVALPTSTSRVSPVVRLTPHGLTLEEPAVLSFPVTGGNEPVEHWRLADDAATTWQLQGTVDLSGTTAQVSLDSFSLHLMGHTIPNCARCEGRVCGEDPDCGGSCGTCLDTERCTVAGRCEVPLECVPLCDGATCGPDGCGGLCGFCSFLTPQVCGSGNCLPSYSVLTPPCLGQPVAAPWAMVGGCMSRPHRSAYWAPTVPLEIEWSWRPPGALSFSPEALFEPMLTATGALYVSGSRGVWAVHRGRTMWQYLASSTAFGNIVSAPAAYGETVYVLTAGGYLVALNSQSGAVRWNQRISTQELSRTSLHAPLLTDSTVIVQGENGYLSFATDGTPGDSFDMPDSLNSAPISVIDGTIVRLSTTGSIMAGYSIDGAELWAKGGSFGASNFAMSHAAGTLLHFARDFPFDPTTKLIWRNVSDGEEIRRITVAERPRMAISAGGQAMVASGWPRDATHQMIDVTTGAVLYTFSTPVGIAANPVAVAAAQGTYFVTIDLQGLVRVHAHNGTTLTSLQLPASTWVPADPDTGRTPVIGADGRLYVTWGAAEGALFALRPAE